MVALSIVAAIGVPLAFFEQHVAIAHPEFLARDRAPSAEEARTILPIEYALYSEDRNDVIYLGDSTCMGCAIPAEIEKRCGVRCWNLGIFGPASIDGTRIVARGYLSRHPAPELVVLVVCPETLSHDRAGKNFAKNLVITYGPCVGVEPRDAGSCFQRMLRFISLDQETVERGAAILVADGRAWLGLGPNAVDCRQRPTGGFKVSVDELTKDYRRVRGVARGIAGFDTKFQERPGFRVQVLSEWRDGIRELASLTEAHGARFMIRLAPIRSDAKSENFSEVTDWLREFQTEFPRAIVKADLFFYEPSLCLDRIHLNGPGADRFTNVLVEDLRQIKVAGCRQEQPAERDKSAHAGPPAPGSRAFGPTR